MEELDEERSLSEAAPPPHHHQMSAKNVIAMFIGVATAFHMSIHCHCFPVSMPLSSLLSLMDPEMDVPLTGLIPFF